MNKRIQKRVSSKILQKAYFVSNTPCEKATEQEEKEMEPLEKLPEEFYRVLGKILCFVEMAERDQEKD